MIEFIIKYWLEVIFAAILALVGFGYRKLSKSVTARLSEQELVKDGILAILHDRLYQAGEFNINRGFCPIKEKKNIEYLYESYHALGGNGTGTEIYNRVLALPIKPKTEGSNIYE